MSFRDLFGPKRDPHTGLPYGELPTSPVIAADAVEGDRLTLHDRDVIQDRGAGYRRGRADQRDVDRRRLKEADAKRRHRGSGFGLVSFLLLVAAAVGVTWIVLAYQAGSFAGGGAVVDQKVAEVTQPAKDAATNAVDRTGAAIEQAGQSVEAQGAKLRQKAE